MNLLIVDDEYLVVEEVVTVTDWGMLGITEIYSATNAVSAVRILNEKKIDIMICDIEMPQTDGKTEKIPILTYEIDGKSENVYAAQDGDIKEFKEIIDNVKIVQRKDSPIIGIVQAEALYYFDGQKSMKETIDTMKNRIEIYEKENSY